MFREVGMAVPKSKETGWCNGASLLHCIWLPNCNHGLASKRCSRGCSVTLVANQPTLVPLLFGTAMPTSLNNL